MPSLITEEDDETTINIENTKKNAIKPLPEISVPSQFLAPQQTIFQKYWKIGIAILCILILLIVLVITVYSINKNPVVNSQVLNPPMPIFLPTPTPTTTSATTSATTHKSTGFFNNLFGRKTAPIDINTTAQVPVSAQVPVAVPAPVVGQAFVTNTVPKQENANIFKRFFGKTSEPVVPNVPKVGGKVTSKGGRKVTAKVSNKGGKNNIVTSKSIVSSTIKKAIKDMKKIKSGKLMKGGCGCDTQSTVLPNINL